MGMDPACRPAALKKLPAVRLGPGRATSRVNDWLKTPAIAVTVTTPAALPAVTVTWAVPVLSVSVIMDVRPPMVAGPFTRKVTGIFADGPAVVVTCTASGCEKGAPASEVWPSPDTFVTPPKVTTTTAFMVKVVEMLLLAPVRAALTVTWPAAEFANVTVVEARPC